MTTTTETDVYGLTRLKFVNSYGVPIYSYDEGHTWRDRAIDARRSATGEKTDGNARAVLESRSVVA